MSSLKDIVQPLPSPQLYTFNKLLDISASVHRAPHYILSYFNMLWGSCEEAIQVREGLLIHASTESSFFVRRVKKKDEK